ncbi:MAG: bifunctional phosphoglucose/phosphomannose isomerase [Patescibacteria group bacterium]
MQQPIDKQLLESRERIAQFDKSKMLGSIEALADQINQAWQETQKINFSPSAEIKNVVVSGMGGSALGAHVIQSLFQNKLTVPITIVNDYALPGFVNQTTLVILSSYSGNTEETLSCAEEALTKHAQIMVITSGGKLQEFAEKHNKPIYLIDPKHNPSDQPRMAIGYSVFGQIGLFAKANLLQITQEEIDQVITTIIDVTQKNNVEVLPDKNQAKLLAYACLEKKPILVSAEFLAGASHVATNQFNENAKIFADYKVVPELNHHLMEGLRFPTSNSLTDLFLIVNSNLYQQRNQKRLELTKQVIQDNQIEIETIELVSETKLTQVFELITLLSFTNFYLAILEKIDPSPIPFVDWFKSQLS